jgi:hypothetical protein
MSGTCKSCALFVNSTHYCYHGQEEMEIFYSQFEEPDAAATIAEVTDEVQISVLEFNEMELADKFDADFYVKTKKESKYVGPDVDKLREKAARASKPSTRMRDVQHNNIPTEYNAPDGWYCGTQNRRYFSDYISLCPTCGIQDTIHKKLFEDCQECKQNTIKSQMIVEQQAVEIAFYNNKKFFSQFKQEDQEDQDQEEDQNHNDFDADATIDSTIFKITSRQSRESRKITLYLKCRKMDFCRNKQRAKTSRAACSKY